MRVRQASALCPVRGRVRGPTRKEAGATTVRRAGFWEGAAQQVRRASAVARQQASDGGRRDAGRRANGLMSRGSTPLGKAPAERACQRGPLQQTWGRGAGAFWWVGGGQGRSSALRGGARAPLLVARYLCRQAVLAGTSQRHQWHARMVAARPRARRNQTMSVDPRQNRMDTATAWTAASYYVVHRSAVLGEARARAGVGEEGATRQGGRRTCTPYITA